METLGELWDTFRDEESERSFQAMIQVREALSKESEEFVQKKQQFAEYERAHTRNYETKTWQINDLRKRSEDILTKPLPAIEELKVLLSREGTR